MSNLIVAKGLNKTFHTKLGDVVALDDINIEIEESCISMLVGPDGAGKTTFLRMCAGLLKPSKGSLQVFNFDASIDSEAIEENVSYMPQKFGLYEDLTVMENLNLYGKLYGVIGANFNSKCEELLRMTDLKRFTNRLAGKLSGGMKQKLGLACTMLSSPKLLILDEPCVGVDPLSRVDLWKIINRMVATEKTTVLVSTAYLDETQFAHKVYVFDHAKILVACTPKELEEFAKDRTYTYKLPLGKLSRDEQLKLFERQDLVTDAVPFAGNINVTLNKGVSPDSVLDKQIIETSLTSRNPNVEDGFMCVFREKQEQSSSFDFNATPNTTISESSNRMQSATKDVLPTNNIKNNIQEHQKIIYQHLLKR